MKKSSWILLLSLFVLTLAWSSYCEEEIRNVSQSTKPSATRSLTPEIQSALQALQTVINGGAATPPFTTSLTDLKIGIIDALSTFKLNPFIISDALITAWKSTLPTFVPLGNFSLLQLALVLAIGGLAAGAAVIAAEAFYFKELDEEERVYAQLRRDYDFLRYGKNSRQAIVTTKRPPARTLPPNRFKPQSLKRNQRRNQRKNKNAGAQLEYYKKKKAAEAAAAAKRRRGRRQVHSEVTFDPWAFNPQYPTIAPRPVHTFKRGSPPGQNSLFRRPFAPPKFPVKDQKSEDMFSFKFITNFIRRQSTGWMKYLPSFPFWSKNSDKNPPQRKTVYFFPDQNSQLEYVRPRLNSKKNTVSKKLIRHRKNR